jgi:hypothetical protein
VRVSMSVLLTAVKFGSDNSGAESVQAHYADSRVVTRRK